MKTSPLALLLLGSLAVTGEIGFAQSQVSGACECKATFNSRSLNGFIVLFDVTRYNASDGCSDGQWVSGVGDPPSPPVLVSGCEKLTGEDLDTCEFIGTVSGSHPQNHFFNYPPTPLSISLQCEDFNFYKVFVADNPGSTQIAGYYAACGPCEAD
jgi:hypothetical protein